MPEGQFEEFRDSIQRLGGTVPIEPEDEAALKGAAAAIEGLPRLTVPALAKMIGSHPEWIRILGLCVRLSGEQLKGVLRHRFHTESLRRLATDHAREVIDLLDSEFALLEELRVQRKRRWSFTDVLVERFASRLRAAGSVGRGRRVEDLVEAIVGELGLAHQMRTSFRGRGGEVGPCDLAIPAGGEKAQIICAIKGFDATGSKLTDASREIARMAEIRLAKQYVFAVVDGLGWLRRQSDLKRIHELTTEKSIDGLYTLSRLGEFREALVDAARRLGLS